MWHEGLMFGDGNSKQNVRRRTENEETICWKWLVSLQQKATGVIANGRDIHFDCGLSEL